jgi:polysaccharide export outer membrane protein
MQRDGSIHCQLPAASCQLRDSVILRHFALCILHFALLLWLAAVSASAQVSPPPQSPAAPPDYVVGPQDVLSVTVWDDTSISGKYTVEADGSFTFPWIGRVKAAGLTLRQIDTELKKRLADGYFKNPQLSVSIDTYGSQKVFIVGEVRTPGTYVLSGNMSLIEALSRAGSTTPNAGTEALIVRAPEGKPVDGPLMDGEGAQTVRVNLKDLESGSGGLNVALRDGDTISIPRAETVFVSGFVKNPGAYPLQFKDMTVLQALSLAGGMTDRGSSSRIKILRVVGGKKTEIKAKLTDLVLPGDTIVVPERFF